MSQGAALQLVGILLAGGTGSRFGSAKLVHPLADGVAIAAHAARNLLAAIPDVISVVRWGDFPLYEMLEQEGCEVLMSQDAVRGMGASLAHGVSRMKDADGWVVTLADMPNVSPETIRGVAAALADGALIAAPVCEGRRGHPVGFGAPLREELTALDGDEGARRILEKHAASVRLIDCDDRGVLYDIDRPADLDAAPDRPRT
jgi:molybdenum cofactor cytidylyltransferase